MADHPTQTIGDPAAADQEHRVFIARQPIVDRAGRVFGYELLYRQRETDSACNRQGTLVSAEVLTHALLGLGLDTLTAGRPAFLNFSTDLLLSGVGTLLPPAGTVIELLEGVHVTAEVVAACRELHAAGFSLALDDFEEGSAAEALLPFAKFVKVDVLQTSPLGLSRIAQRFVPRGIRLIAEKVETQEAVARAAAMGYQLFQGFHFCRPTTMSGGAVTPGRLAQVQLLAALTDRDMSIDRLEAIVSRDVALTYRVLRCVSSAAFGQSRQIQSIRQALVLLGVDHIRKWALVWSLAALNAGGVPEILTVALVRARCTELLGETLDGADAAEYFLLGLCSLLDAILQQPMPQAIADIPLSDTVRSALHGAPTVPRSVLDAVVAYERGGWDTAAAAVRPLGIPESALPKAYAEALLWPRAFAQGTAA